MENKMKMFIVIDGNENDKDETKYEYNVGEKITLNSSIPIKCIKKEEKNGELLQYFKTARMTFDWDDEKEVVNTKKDNGEKFRSNDEMSKEEIQKIKEILSVRVLGNIKDKSVENILRALVFNPNIQNDIEWDWVKQSIIKEMPEMVNKF
jgi:hypothetical protein